MAIDTLADMEILFDQIPLDKVSTSRTINASAAILLAMYIAVAEKQGVARNKIIGTIQKGESEFFAMSRNPLGFGMGKMTGMLMKGGIYGIIALAVISMAQQIFEEVKKLYAPGGPFDIRKQMMDRDREMIEIEHLIDRRAGRVFFTADTDLIQGSPEINSGNTNRVVQQTLRYQNLHHDE